MLVLLGRRVPAAGHPSRKARAGLPPASATVCGNTLGNGDGGSARGHAGSRRRAGTAHSSAAYWPTPWMPVLSTSKICTATARRQDSQGSKTTPEGSSLGQDNAACHGARCRAARSPSCRGQRRRTAPWGLGQPAAWHTPAVHTVRMNAQCVAQNVLPQQCCS